MPGKGCKSIIFSSEKKMNDKCIIRFKNKAISKILHGKILCKNENAPTFIFTLQRIPLCYNKHFLLLFLLFLPVSFKLVLLLFYIILPPLSLAPPPPILKCVC